VPRRRSPARLHGAPDPAEVFQNNAELDDPRPGDQSSRITPNSTTLGRATSRSGPFIVDGGQSRSHSPFLSSNRISMSSTPVNNSVRIGGVADVRSITLQ
jgi:hypothetical protein